MIIAVIKMEKSLTSISNPAPNTESDIKFYRAD